MKKLPIGIVADMLQMPFYESVQAAQQLGVSGLQFYAVSGELAPENMTAQTICEKKTILSDHGIELSALCGDLGGHGFCIAEDNKTKVERSKRIIDLALELGTNIVTTHIGVVPADASSKTYDVLHTACDELAAYAKSCNAYFAIETGPEPADRLKNFLDSLCSRHVAVNLDPANLVMVTGDDPVQAVHTLKDYIVHTHAKDGIMLRKTDPQIIYDCFAVGGIEELNVSDYFLETPLGEGKVDFNAYLHALEEIGYQGYLTVEREAGADRFGDIRKAIEYLRSFYV